MLGVSSLDANGVVKRVESTEFMSEDEVVGQNFYPLYGYGFGDDEPSTYAVRPVVQHTVEQDGELYAMTVKKGCGGAGKYCFDIYGQPTQSTDVSSLGFSRDQLTEYKNDTALWILGQVSKRTVAGLVAEETAFDSLARPETVKAFGKVQQKLTYYPNTGSDATQRGVVSGVSDGRDTSSFDTTILLSNWKRGIPQLITHPATVDQTTAVTESAAVDDNGWILSVVDENKSKTCYAYDTMGRIATVTYPSETAASTCDASKWAITTSTFAQTASSAAEYGIPGGHWKQTVDTGKERRVTYFDAMWRPLVEERFDNTSSTTASATRSIVAKRYDLAGLPAFQSYPLRTLSSYAATTLNGVKTTYDALQRVTTSVQDSEYGTLTTAMAYVPAAGSVHAHLQVTDPNTKVTKTWFQAFDQPSQDAPVAIQHPEGAYTDIVRDLLGKPRSITRRNAANTIAATRSYVYDAFQQLCKAVEPETGATVMDYDAANNMIWSASGQNLLSTSSCNTGNVPVAQMVTRSYDARGRVKTLVFPDNLGNTTYTYAADGKVVQRLVDNGGSDLVVGNQTYFRRGQPKTDQLKVGGNTWTLTYGYDANASPASVTYPDGVAVDYAPNALGQPSKAGTYATGVTYHPNGGMAGFTYGNGIVHSMTQNLRQLPERSKDGAVLDDTYLYDANGNVDSITDGLSGNRGNRSMTYDGLNRLKTATSPMYSGGTTYTYDALDNLVRVKAPGRDHTYVYDANWRLQTVTNTSGGAAVYGLTYDARGNLKSKASQGYQFDTGNRLREVTGLESYLYDGEGRRVQAKHPVQGSIYSFYGSDGVLRMQRDERLGKQTDYVMLNGSLVARVSNTVAPPVPVLSAPGYSSNGSYTVSWNAVTGASRYELQERVGTGAWAEVYDGAALSKAFSGKATGTYGYQVRACNPSACGGWSAVASVSVTLPPAAAPTLSAPATALNGDYTVSWTTAAGATSYTLEESANGGAWTAAYTGTALSKAYTGKAAGSYGYRVKACNSAGCSGYSATKTVQSVHPPTGKPTLTVPASSTTGSYTASWTAVSGASSYTLEEQLGSGSWTAYSAITGTSKAISGKASGTYNYRVKACNAAGCGPVSATGSITVLLAPAAAPAITAPASNTTGSYTVSWSTVATASKYEIQENLNGGGWSALYSGTALSKAIAGKTSGSYGYRGRACNTTGCGPYSATKTVTVLTKPATPAMTSSIKRQWYVGNRIEIECSASWTAVAGAATYELKAGTADGPGDVQYQGPATSVSGVRSSAAYCSDTKVVRACNTTGCSAWSNPPYPQVVKDMNSPPNPGCPTCPPTLQGEDEAPPETGDEPQADGGPESDDQPEGESEPEADGEPGEGA